MLFVILSSSLSLSLFFFFSLLLSFNLSASIFLFQHLFSLLHRAYLHIPRTNLPLFLRIVYFCLDRANWFQAVHAFLRRRLCVHEYSLFLFYFFPAAVSFTYLVYLHTSLRLCFLLFVFLSLLFPSLRRPFLSLSLFLSVSVSSSFSVISRGELRLPTYARLAVLSRTRERNERRSASHYQNSNVLLFSILQIESKYKIASSSINNLYRKNTKG